MAFNSSNARRFARSPFIHCVGVVFGLRHIALSHINYRHTWSRCTASRTRLSLPVADDFHAVIYLLYFLVVQSTRATTTHSNRFRWGRNHPPLSTSYILLALPRRHRIFATGVL